MTTENGQEASYIAYLVQAGLDKDQATIYECLIKNGQLPAGKISQKTPLKRGLVYKILDDLVETGLVIKHEEPKKVAVFEPAHPLKLKELAEKKEEQAKSAQLVLESILNPLVSEFNLVIGKPGVMLFEGLDGIKKVINDTLRSRTEILSYADIESIIKYLKNVNDEYVESRERLKIKKRGIVLDTPFARNYLANYHKNVTETRLIKFDAPPFQSVMYIYDNKISYITISLQRMIGVIIEDPNLFQMHRYLFEFTWNSAKEIIT